MIRKSSVQRKQLNEQEREGEIYAIALVWVAIFLEGNKRADLAHNLFLL